MAEDSPSQARGTTSTSPGGLCDLSCLLSLGLEVFSLEMWAALVSAWGQAHTLAEEGEGGRRRGWGSCRHRGGGREGQAKQPWLTCVPAKP